MASLTSLIYDLPIPMYAGCCGASSPVNLHKVNNSVSTVIESAGSRATRAADLSSPCKARSAGLSRVLFCSISSGVGGMARSNAADRAVTWGRKLVSMCMF